MSTVPIPFQLHRSFETKLRNFPEDLYKFGKDQHLTKFMKVLLEDAGVGQLYKIQTVSRLNEALGGTQFSELDFFFGSFLQFPRVVDEMYEYDPFNDQLLAEQWREVETKDARYRERISLFLQSLCYGGTNQGLAMAAEAACGLPCTILESWRYSQDVGLGSYIGRLTSAPAREIVVVPHLTVGDGIFEYQRRNIYKTLNRLKPPNTVITVDAYGLSIRTPVNIRSAASPSEYYEIRKYVTAVDPPPPPPDDRYYWIEDGVETEAPSFAYLETMEEKWSNNNAITNVQAFEIGPDDVTRYQQFGLMQASDIQWGPWRAIELADSPDNYPDGKYAGDPSKYDTGGTYLYAWASQAEYVAWLATSVQAMNGEIADDRYRLPASSDLAPADVSDPWDSLAPVEVNLQTLYYDR